MTSRTERALAEMEPYILNRARAMCSRLVPAEDLAQEGRVAVARAWDDYDPRAGRWTTYAYHRMAGAMRHYVRDKGRLIKVPAWKYEQAGDWPPNPVSLDSILPGGRFRERWDEDRTPRPDIELRVEIERAMGTLPEIERRAIERYFWLQMDQREIGEADGVAHNTVSSRIMRGLRKLRRALGCWEDVR